MRKTTRLFSLFAAVAAFTLLGLGCESDHDMHDGYGHHDHPDSAGDHDHPKSSTDAPRPDHPTH